jgi:hypothetical protein
MEQDDKNTKIFINPSGFIEQHYYGNISSEAVLDGLKQLRAYAKKQKAAGKKVLILEDTIMLSKLDFLSPKMAAVRKEAAKATKEIIFEKAAVYGPLHLQVIISTLALIAGKSNHIKVFDSRADAVKWLLSE